MARQPAKAEGVKDASVASIAATLLQKAEPAPETASEPDEVVEIDAEDASADVDELDDTSDADRQEDDEDESPMSGTDDEEEGELTDADVDEDDEQVGDDETEYLDIRDDDLMTVVVDDVEQEVSIGDLKRNFSLGKATEKRLQEATEMRKEAHAAQTKSLEDLAAQTALLDSVFDGLDDTFYKGVIPAPDERVRQTNPDAYLRHKEAYDAEQANIKAAKEALEAKRKEVADRRAIALKEYSEKAAQVVAKYIPELADPKTANQSFANMTAMAQAYGYTAKEINSALDPRMFLIMRDLVKYHGLVNKTKGRDVMANDGQKDKKVRRLRSGNTTARNRARASDKQRKQATETARNTGKVKDVAATLLVPNPKR